MNCCPTDTKIPVKELIAATKYGIKELSELEGEANFVCCDVLRTESVEESQAKSNISRDGKTALKITNGKGSSMNSVWTKPWTPIPSFSNHTQHHFESKAYQNTQSKTNCIVSVC